MQYIVDTCRPGGDDSLFAEIYSESKKIMSGAGAPEYLMTRYDPPRLIDGSPTTRILSKVKAYSVSSVNAPYAILADTDDQVLQLFEKSLVSFGREVGSKDWERPDPISVTKLLLFIAKRREHIALCEEAYEQMRQAGQKKMPGVKSQVGYYKSTVIDVPPLLQGIVASINEDTQAYMESLLKDFEKSPKISAFQMVMSSLSQALNFKAINVSVCVDL